MIFTEKKLLFDNNTDTEAKKMAKKWSMASSRTVSRIDYGHKR